MSFYVNNILVVSNTHVKSNRKATMLRVNGTHILDFSLTSTICYQLMHLQLDKHKAKHNTTGPL